LFLTSADCEGFGGSFGGDGSTCAPNSCPDQPATCADSVYSQTDYDRVNGLINERDTEGVFPDGFIVNDFSLDADTTVTGIRILISDLFFQFFANGSGDVILLADDGGAPGAVITELTDLGGVFLDPTLDAAFGSPVNLYGIDGLDLALDGGVTYWIGFRAVMTSDPDGFGGVAYQLTTPVVGSEAYWRSDFFGFPDFTPMTDILGAPSDFAFCLTTGVVDPCAGIVRGDSNGDGLVNFDDIDCFVSALVSSDAWEACGTTYPPSAYQCANDIDQNGSVDFDDIDPFVECLINEGCL